MSEFSHTEKSGQEQQAAGAQGGDATADPRRAAAGGPAEQQGEAAAADAAAEHIEEAKDAPREGEGQVAMKRGGGGGAKSPGAVAAKAIQGKGEGSALAPEMQEHFSASYGQDMSGVRVHNDSKANAAADRAGAEAFTYGKDVFFGSGRFQPEQEHG